MKDDIVVKSLKEKYFALIRKEHIGMTPGITKELDNLEEGIRQLQADRAELRKSKECS